MHGAHGVVCYLSIQTICCYLYPASRLGKVYGAKFNKIKRWENMLFLSFWQISWYHAHVNQDKFIYVQTYTHKHAHTHYDLLYMYIIMI